MIGVVLNPNALGVRRQSGLADRLRGVLGDRGEVIETRHSLDVDEVVGHFARLGCDPVGICGGDGTNLSTLTGFVRRLGPDALPRFALLRGGTVNTVARNLAITGRPEDLLAKLVAKCGTTRTPDEKALDTIEVNGRFGFLFAAAMGARFLEAYYRGPMQGAPWATVMAARTIASSLTSGAYARWLFEPIAVELIADGVKLPIDRVRLLIASSIPDVGIGMRVAWRAGTEPGRFQILASAIPMAKLALQIDRVLRGKPLEGQPHVDRLGSSLSIRFEEPQAWTLDGELFSDDRIEIRTGPRIRVIV